MENNILLPYYDPGLTVFGIASSPRLKAHMGEQPSKGNDIPSFPQLLESLKIPCL